MPTSQTCPHCGSRDHRLLADQIGSVCWCRDCHRAWIPHQAAKLPPSRQTPDRNAHFI